MTVWKFLAAAVLALAVSAEGKRCGDGVECTDDVDSSQVATVKTNWVDAANPTACRALGGDPWSPSGRCYIKPAHLSTEANQLRKTVNRIHPDQIGSPDAVAKAVATLVAEGSDGFAFSALMEFSGLRRYVRGVKLAEALVDIKVGAWWEPVDDLQGDEAEFLEAHARDPGGLAARLRESEPMRRVLHLMLKSVRSAVTAAKLRSVPFAGDTLGPAALAAAMDGDGLTVVQFYKEDCVACYQHAGHVSAFAATLASAPDAVRVVRISCSDHLRYCRDANPDGLSFPRIQLRSGGKVLSTYQPGTFREDSLMRWFAKAAAVHVTRSKEEL